MSMSRERRRAKAGAMVEKLGLTCTAQVYRVYEDVGLPRQLGVERARALFNMPSAPRFEEVSRWAASYSNATYAYYGLLPDLPSTHGTVPRMQDLVARQITCERAAVAASGRFSGLLRGSAGGGHRRQICHGMTSTTPSSAGGASKQARHAQFGLLLKTRDRRGTGHTVQSEKLNINICETGFGPFGTVPGRRVPCHAESLLPLS